jgi:preprotein translocase subunit YajC
MNVAHAADLAFAPTSAPGGFPGGPAALLANPAIWLVAMFLIMYFMMIRPQQKQRRDRDAMLNALKRGDRVVTSGGLHGTITNITDTTVTLRCDQVKLEFDRSAVGRVLTPGGGDKDA